MKRLYLSGIKSIDAMIPRSLQALLHNIAFLCTAVGKPATCSGCQSRLKEVEIDLCIPREKMETLRPVGPRWRKTYAKISIAICGVQIKVGVGGNGIR